MALFFDEDWFNQQLAKQNKNRADLARALNMDQAAIEMIWKDQRALTAHEVAQAAQFFHVAAAEITKRAGCATPQIKRADQDSSANQRDLAETRARLDELSARLENIERLLADLKHILLAQNMPPPPSQKSG